MRWDCEDYRRWVASLPCAACGIEADIQVHHIKGVGGLSGVALKASDVWAMPLCVDCHAHLHNNMTRANAQMQWEWAARTMAAFLEALVNGLGEDTMRTAVRGVCRAGVIGGRSR